MNDLEGVLREQVIQDWRGLDNLTPQEAHSSSRIMRTYVINLNQLEQYFCEKV